MIKHRLWISYGYEYHSYRYCTDRNESIRRVLIARPRRSPENATTAVSWACDHRGGTVPIAALPSDVVQRQSLIFVWWPVPRIHSIEMLFICLLILACCWTCCVHSITCCWFVYIYVTCCCLAPLLFPYIHSIACCWFLYIFIIHLLFCCWLVYILLAVNLCTYFICC